MSFSLVLIWISLLDRWEKTIKGNNGWLLSFMIELNFLWVAIKNISEMSQKSGLPTSLLPYLSDLFINSFSLCLTFPPHAVMQKDITLLIQDSKNRVKILLSTWNLETLLIKWSLWLTLLWTFLLFSTQSRFSSNTTPRYL